MNEDDFHMLEQPFLTEEGFVNPACMNELEQWIKNMPPDWERLKDDPEWSVRKWTLLKDITGAFSKWSVRQLKTLPFPPDLEKLIGYLDACLRSEFKKIPDYEPKDYIMAKLSLCEINKMLWDILGETELFKQWNEETALGKDWLDLDALLINVCIDIRTERRENERFDRKFERKWNNMRCPH